MINLFLIVTPLNLFWLNIFNAFNYNFYNLLASKSNSPLAQFEKITNEIICPFDIVGLIVGLSNYSEALIFLIAFHVIWQLVMFFITKINNNSQFRLKLEKNFFSRLLGVNNYYLMYASTANLICLINSSGLIPYSKTLTAQVTVAFSFAFLLLVSLWLMGIKKKKLTLLNLFFPNGVPNEIISPISLIETFSFISRIVSLTVRLFANITAGHALLKILAGFFKAFIKQPLLITLYCGSLLWTVIFIISLLEIIISLLQAYVFVTLILTFIDELCSLYIAKNSRLMINHAISLLFISL